jgi:hypothetical protein
VIIPYPLAVYTKKKIPRELRGIELMRIQKIFGAILRFICERYTRFIPKKNSVRSGCLSILLLNSVRFNIFLTL